MRNRADTPSRLTPERWRQIDQLLEKALELEPDSQESFLDTACAGDPDLRAELVSLLVEHKRSAGILDRPAVGAVATALAHDQGESLVGRRFCSYQILAPLGSGGMGVVYRALDTRLDRTVALKVLPDDLVHDKERMRRFTTEAKAASSLNHPDICTVYELGECQGIRFITMEYVDGQTVSEVAGQRSLSVPEIVDAGIQVADALDAAHGRGIIHRDIKPGNLMMTARGLVKVLDFGIAKVKRSARPGSESAGTTLTQEGVILGTVDYMSPEQVLGRDLDHRTDIFSLGAVLYELATGRLPFRGNSPTETMDRILHAQPESFKRSNIHLPSDLERIIRKCLEKNPKWRYQSAGELLTELKNLRQEISRGPMRRSFIRVSSRTALAAILIVAALTVIALAWLIPVLLRTPAVETPLAVVPLTSYPGFESNPTFSPDGTQVAFSWARETDSDCHIYIKQVGSEALFQLTSDKAADDDPAWSPDGRWIAFLRWQQERPETNSLIVKSPLGGVERVLAEVRFPVTLWWNANIAWHPKGKWLVMPDRPVESEPCALFALSLETGEKRRLTSPPAGALGDGGPSFSPDGSTLGFARYASPHTASVYLLTVSDRLVATGEPVQITHDPRSFGPEWTPDGSEIVYVSGSIHAPSLWRLDAKRLRNPRRLPLSGRFFAPSFSRQGHLAFVQKLEDVNIWKLDSALPKDAAPVPTKLISSTYVDHIPRFSPDGRHITFASYRSGYSEIWVCDRDGSNPVQLTRFAGPETALPAWSPDARQIAFGSKGQGLDDVYVIDAQGGSPRQLTSGPSDDGAPCYSRDGNWIYFESDRTGRFEIWKTRLDGHETIRVTRKGGNLPRLSPDGKFIYYLKESGGESGSLWRKPVDGGDERQILPVVYANDYAVVSRGIYFIPTADPPSSVNFLSFKTGKVTRLLTLPRMPAWGFDVSPDEQEILFTQFNGGGADLMLIENFR